MDILENRKYCIYNKWLLDNEEVIISDNSYSMKFCY